METADHALTMTDVLEDLTYPAEKWAVIACAQIYGVDARTRRELYALPVRTYRDAGEIMAVLDKSAQRRGYTSRPEVADDSVRSGIAGTEPESDD